ncbi:E3 ubiquitin-protein ligase rnf213-alpha-like [Mercenaria mercenaria]|uniref:E3 ubiquitin-protein ligase rnf213-alpha-like n=1 Tax=Mercenaria mercenaria TaxID=6596 RepID=UPI00234F463B|nr:E3 ubiquitin-protein ligase rnf213-alpha-like [Mercenaria mercenaria]
MLGGWHNNQHVLFYDWQYPSGHYEMSYQLEIPRYLASRSLEYKYFVIRNTETRKGFDRKNLWDYYYVRGHAGPHYNRRLQLPDKWKSKANWHQFDAIINRKPKDGLVSWVKDYWSRTKKLKEDATLAVQIYSGRILQAFNNVNSSPDDISYAVELLEMMVHGLRRVYVQDSNCFEKEDEFMSTLGEHVMEPVIRSFDECIELKGDGTDVQLQRRMTVQFALLAILKNLGLSQLKNKYANIHHRLCMAFLIHLDPDKKTCKELEFLKLHFPKQLKFFKEALVMLGKSVIVDKKNPAWLFIMPLIHFLSDTCAPYDSVTDDAAHAGNVPVWWGTSHIGEDTTKKFKSFQNQSWVIPLGDVLKTLQRFFEIDYLLPRTIVASLNLYEIFEAISTGLIPTEVCCAALIYYLKTTRPKHSYDGPSSNEENLVCKCIQTVYKQLQEECKKSPDRNCVTRWKLAATISLDLVEEALYYKTDRHVTASSSMSVCLMCVSQYQLSLETMKNTQLKQDKNFSDIRYVCEKAIQWLQRHWDDWTCLDVCLEVWDSFIVNEAAILEVFTSLWNESIVKELNKRLTYFIRRDNSNTEKFVQFYCQKVEQFQPYMQTCLEQVAFKAIDRACEMDVRSLQDYGRRKFGQLLSKMFEKEWQNIMENAPSVRQTEFLENILTWSPFLQFMKIFFTKQEMDLLNDECKLKLMRTISEVDTRVDELLAGNLLVGDLLLLHKHAEKFSVMAELVKSTETEKRVTADIVRGAIKVRKKELDYFLSRTDAIATLTFLCKKLTKVDLSSLELVLEKRINLKANRLRELCVPAAIADVKKIDDFEPYINVFQISAQLDSVLHRMVECQKSSIFMKMWESQCEIDFETCTSVENVVSIWQPVYKRWQEAARSIESGKIQFIEFERLIGRMFGENYDMISEELRILNVSHKVISKRIDQLRKYRHLESCRKGAKTFLYFKREYDLRGDFEQIKLIAGEEEGQLEVEQFDDSFMNAFDFLKDLTTKRAHCLSTFLKCQPLVQWLKESMQSGLKELQVFVDLALMSIGDDPYNIGKVQALHSAVTGFAPLIFDLNQECGYEELLALCKLVWRELDVNQKLPKQLEDTNLQLEWLKEIKEAHGSVEVTSMMQTEAINSDGTFTVGRRAMDRNRQSKPLDVNVLRQLKGYTFSQLQDLQSRLMLVAGKAEKGVESVERFTMIFDSVTRLSKVFVKLYSSGCVLFKEWSARFICDPDPRRPVCAVIDFGQSEEVPQLKGRTSVNEDLKDMIPEIARFMENCHEEWLQHITEKRKSYLYLNYFTIDQLVILQRELVKIGTDERPLHWIYPLLSAVKLECTEGDVLQAMQSAKEEVDRKDHMETETSFDANQSEHTKHENDEKIQTFIRSLVDAGLDETMAIKALNHVDPDDISQGILWCMEHTESEDEDMEVSETEVSSQAPYQGWSQSEVSIKSLIESGISGLRQDSEVGVKPLMQNLEQLWTQFIQSISSNVKDYLSLEHLGIILGYLAEKNTHVMERSLPPGLKEGLPNLVVCPSDDVLPTTLSIYMTEKEQPLPQSDEILMCTPATTKDEVDIFWRRALFEGSHKVHCLLNADLLTYEVSEAAEKLLHEYLLQLMHKTNVNYRLCVICGSDRRNRSSTMISFLDKYLRQSPMINMDKLRTYIAQKLVVHTTNARISPAALADDERSTVRVIKSWRSGVGKSLFKSRKERAVLALNAKEVNEESVTIPLQEKDVDLHYVIERLLDHTPKANELTARLFHIDVSHEVQDGVDFLLFNLLILGCLVDKTGYVWRKSNTDLYLIETMPILAKSDDDRGSTLHYLHAMLNILPDVTCRSPRECLLVYAGNTLQGQRESDQLFDVEEFRSEKYQRPFQYLRRLATNRTLQDVKADKQEGTVQLCLETLLRYCGIQDPSWAELHHFVWFLNTQLVDFELNNFVSAAAAEDLPGFSNFVLRFLIQMSKDFSTRSLKISEESPGLTLEHHERMQIDEASPDDKDTDMVELYKIRRTWESSPHPYLFFNRDRMTFTFLGFYIEKESGNLIDQQTGNVLERCIMTKNLYEAMERNHVPLQEDFNSLLRMQKIKKLRDTMGVAYTHDPDPSYELTTDNVKKIMAIYMRFRCDIPVIIMGETGCGKTRLVKFMCKLQEPEKTVVTNMILMKVHGGTTNSDIIKRVRTAETMAKKNQQKYGDHMYTVLFFDEANSSEAIGLIKEIMCDKRVQGEKLKLCENLKIVAACNPYRKHSEQLIKKLEMAGLGYHVDADETTDRLGRVPMRRLVYRVQPLPLSLLPLVWDFGQLNIKVENLYIQQMVKRYIDAAHLPNIKGLKEVTSEILTKSQQYMRQQKDECSFVSLRDVERVLTVMSWFYTQSQNNRILFSLMDKRLHQGPVVDASQNINRIDDVTRSLILALGVCYHACLKTREQYREFIAQYFAIPCKLPKGRGQILEEIDCCQDVFLDHVDLEKNIARNMALKENVFMMVVCIELRIPLFLIGKPGSSKSLAKTIVSDAMRGNAAKHILFKGMKQAKLVSYQCSPISTPGGIVGTFKQCAQFQKDKDLSTFVSVVVLDEVGLAEDSLRMPLKTLHPLLEDGCQGDEKPEKYMKVAFIGISNWALDPAKMNRGIVVQREVPDLEELINSARGICTIGEDLEKRNRMEPLIKPMAKAYLELFTTASKKMREFFGLRDFYSLVKMVFSFVEKSNKTPTWHQMLHAIKRNFGGLDQVDPVDCFKKHLSTIISSEHQPKDDDPDCSAAGLIRACLDTNNIESESRYLLLLTENYGALTIIQQLIQERSEDIRPITIFGSSFRSDQEYTQVCRNINKIKVCMETGNTVVLLNLENLYESLYDALNQYYVYFGGVRYVDLGLGTHRVKCPVHHNFRLIVVAEKQTVYKKFPIPLINRLEKHFLTLNTMLSDLQQKLVYELEQWAVHFASQRQTTLFRRETEETMVGDVFIGFHEDSCSAVIHHVCQKYSQNIRDFDEETTLKILKEAKCLLLWCATPDALVRLERSSLPIPEQEWLRQKYLDEQPHNSILEYLSYMIHHNRNKEILSQITTHSKLMTTIQIPDISRASGIDPKKILLIDTLSSFDTEQQFSNKIRQHVKDMADSAKMIMIQCECGDVNASLIACARYCVMDELEKLRDDIKELIHVVFVIQLPKVSGGCFSGFQCGKWHSAHIDDLLPEDMQLPSLKEMHGQSVGKLIDSAMSEKVLMETDGLEKEKRPIEEEMDWKSDKEEISVDSEYHSVYTSLAERTSTKDGLNLEDVVFDFENVDENEGITKKKESGRPKLNVKKLVLSCVQSALSMVKDKDERKNRETDRVDLVIRLLHQDQIEGQPSFLQGICMLISKLLQEKEKNAGTTHKATHWLVNEAAKLENINKAGTFRSSCIKILESKVFPILAGIIAYCDKNENLNILQETQYPWKQDLWLEILNTPGAIDLQYNEFQSPTRSSDLEEVTVMSTGCEGLLFCNRMPFSWRFIDMINEVLKLDHPSADSVAEEEGDSQNMRKRNLRAESCKRILSEHPLCKPLSGINEERIVQDATTEYTCDVIHTMYPVANDQEFNLVFNAIMETASQLSDGISHDSLLGSVVYTHLAFEAVSSRLTYFHMLNVAWPECSKTILEKRAEKPDHFMFKENEMTFTAVCLLVENMSPTKSQLDTEAGRSKWLNNVHRYRSMVEKVISLYDKEPVLHGPSVTHVVRRIKGLWTRVMVMKLFVEHVCVSDRENRITVKFCTPLWSLLGEEADMKKKESINAVEKFLKTCNRGAMKEYLGSVIKCSDCETVLEGFPITLPCKDVLCERCYNDLIASRSNTCTKCRKQFGDDWTPAKTVTKSNAEEKLRDYQKRCNAFFMDVVSQLSFAHRTAPSDDVVEKLLTYTFCETRGKRQHTKNLSIFDTGIDLNPVFRSFLLQLLLQTSENEVIANLERYLRQAESVVKDEASDREQMYINLSLLVINCVEDKLMQTGCADGIDRIGYAISALEKASKTIDTDGLTVKKLYGLASARMGLSVVANQIAEMVKKGSSGSLTMKLIDAAKQLCVNAKTKCPRNYLAKYMCRFYGTDVYQAACKSPCFDLTWMAIMKINTVVSDRYIVCGNVYTEMRDTVTKTILGRNIDVLQGMVQEQNELGVFVEPILQLAVYREITTSYLHPQEHRNVTPEVSKKISDFINGCDTLQNKQLLVTLIDNRLTPSHLVTTEAEDLRLQGIQSLIVHFLAVMKHLKGEKTLLRPLYSLVAKPQLCTNFFIPTMPQDDLEDVKEAILASRGTVKGADQTAAFYRCPNGHPYVIGDCGRPFVKAKCQCGAEIGGRAHKLLETNTVDNAKDLTMTGHILGRAERRGPGPKPERLMTPAQCATVRLLVHMAMYLGAGSDIQGIKSIIKPDIETDQVEEFLWQHIQLDVEDLHNAITRSVDDVLLFMHSVINGILKKHNAGDVVEEDVYRLSTKRGRQKWEVDFVGKFISEYFMNMDSYLQQYNGLLVGDKRLASPLENIPTVWRYRTPVSLQHLRQGLDAEIGRTGSSHKTFNVLELFLKEEYHLRALRFIPSIMRLQRILLQKYMKKLDKAEASQITVAQLKKEEIAGSETPQLISDFAEAWELSREALTFYLCTTESGGALIPKQYCRRCINDETPVSMLLPTTEDEGLCSYVLLDFLMRKQNDFLDKYIKETGRKSENTTRVYPQEVTSAHLISYDPHRDLLPLVLANCQYTFKIGEGTHIEYDFAGLERQLMDRFLFSKSKIDIGIVFQVDLMVYRTEFTNASVFKRLSEYIKQENLNASVKKQICNEMKSLPDVCQSLYNLDIAISFLKSTGGLPEKNLHEYMKKTLQMETTLSSQKAQQMCQFKHVQSLWLLLALLKSKTMTDNQQQREFTFESVQRMYDIDLTENQLENFNHYMTDLSVDKLGLLVEVLHEFILLKVAVKQNTNDDDYMDITENQMKDWLLAYIDEKEIPPLDTVILEDFPEDIKLKHSVHTWIAAYSLLKGKQSGVYSKY